MTLNTKEQQALSILADTLRTRFGASEVILYGSAARGELQEGSDVDLLVVLPKIDWATEKKIIGICYEAELECGRVFSSVFYSSNEMQTGPLRFSPLVLNARREGKSL